MYFHRTAVPVIAALAAAGAWMLVFWFADKPLRRTGVRLVFGRRRRDRRRSRDRPGHPSEGSRFASLTGT